MADVFEISPPLQSLEQHANILVRAMANHYSSQICALLLAIVVSAYWTIWYVSIWLITFFPMGILGLDFLGWTFSIGGLIVAIFAYLKIKIYSFLSSFLPFNLYFLFSLCSFSYLSYARIIFCTSLCLTTSLSVNSCIAIPSIPRSILHA